MVNMLCHEKEYINFNKHFAQYKSKRIVLYGTGRHTADILSILDKEWNIVGLMDQNPEYVGQYFYGFPVLAESEVDSKADMIIINTAKAYWQIIYQRIGEIGVPIYYRNGERAVRDADNCADMDYWQMTKGRLLAEIDRHEIVSFDFYDTLFQRKVYLPSEVFEMIAVQCVSKEEMGEYIQSRKIAESYINEPYASLDMIYDFLQKQLCWPADKTALIKAKEIEIEKKILTPRKDIVQALQYAIDVGKDVYIISDMYLPVEFYVSILDQFHIYVNVSNIWVSCEKKASKEDGTLWKQYREHIGDITALHIGDNLRDDIQNAKKCDIDTVYCMSKNELMAHSSMRSILPLAVSRYHMMVLGLSESYLFDKAFVLGETEGKIKITSCKDLGYVIFGPIICTHLLWIRKKKITDQVKNLTLWGADSCFLQEDYEYMNQLLGGQEISIYHLQDAGVKNISFSSDRNEINEGAKAFIRDMTEYFAAELLNMECIKIDCFIEQWHHRWIDNCIIDKVQYSGER